MMKRSLTWSICLVMLFLGVILGLNRCYSYSSDDCTYALKSNSGTGWGGVSSGYLQETEMGYSRLDSLQEVWCVNAADGYRPVVHFFVRAFTGWLGKGAFDVANTVMMGCFLLLLYRFALSSWRLEFQKTTLAIVLVFLVLCKGESYLWCAGSVNYLWAATMTLLFCLMREYVRRSQVSPLSVFGMSVIACVIGWAQEAFSLPVCFGLGCWGLFNLKRLKMREIIFYVCYGIGTLLLCWKASARAASIEAFTVSGLVMTWVKCAVACKGVWILLIYLLCCKDKRAFLNRNLFELAVIVGSLLLISIVGFNGERSLFAANLFAIVILLREVSLSVGIATAMTGVLLILWGIVLVLGKQVKTNFDTFTTLYLTSPDGVTMHERVHCGLFARFFHQSLYTWQTSGHSQSYAAYYGREVTPLALSERLYNELYLANSFMVESKRLPLEGSFFTSQEENVIVMPLDPSMDAEKEVTAVVKYNFPTDFKFKVWKEIVIRKNPPVPFLNKTRVLKTAHGNYLLIAKIPYCDEYIQSINVEF